MLLPKTLSIPSAWASPETSMKSVRRSPQKIIRRQLAPLEVFFIHQESTCRNIENLQLTKLPNKRAVLEVQPFYLSAYILRVSYSINNFSSVFKKRLHLLHSV